MSERTRKVHDISDSEEEDIEIVPVVRNAVGDIKPPRDLSVRPGTSASASMISRESPTKRFSESQEKNIEILKKRKLDSASDAGDTLGPALDAIIQESSEIVDLDLPPCRYGSMCYQTNQTHVAAFSHINRGLGFYLTKCEGISAKYNADTFTRSLKQILHEDVGDTLESAVHFSYVFEMEWLLNQYPEPYRKLPMLLVVQQNKELLDLLIAQRQVYRNVSLLPIELARFGTHHTKMISLKYKNSLRIIVTTANLYEADWSQKSQMLWVSPLLKKLEPKRGPDSSTGFRASLCAYLRSYGKPKLIDLAESYADYDFSRIQSFFIGSSPHSPRSGLMTLESVLKKNVPPVPSNCPVSFCFSSVGTLGNDDGAWFRSVLGRRLMSSDATTRKALSVSDVTRSNFQPIYPTVEEVRKSLEGYAAGRSLPYSGATHNRQKWLSHWLHHWKADHCGRSRAAPHVKFYIRTSEDFDDTYWFLMTSANLSKAAWGNVELRAPLSYECGILYVPGRPVKTKDLVVPFDLPPERYKLSDRLWVQDSRYAALDDFGNTWDPSKGGAVESV
ncbi:tyrosyl-DNA phosphodiesterase 1 [Galendromus occidentalis]|uniref:Tyrosyl-DNA phosphodiesterase 1 n=1 Tax=Galendromus occidentalis TaxID=34638 RepID=A0AAJ7L7K2_9ACAR|nr:tyrosyl-DNA phosphodiesterase 1 [Galendromus occidentalis]